MSNLYKAGEIVAMEEGEYSDYGVICFVRVLKDFDAKELVMKWIKDHPNEDVYEQVERFIAMLSAEGYIEDIEYRSLWMGHWGTFSNELKGVEEPTIAERISNQSGITTYLSGMTIKMAPGGSGGGGNFTQSSPQVPQQSERNTPPEESANPDDRKE